MSPPRRAAFLTKWSAPDRGWLRKFYRHGSDEPQFDLTPATEKAIAWLASLTERAFVGTESRLRVLFDLVQQMSEGSDTDPQRRLAELQRRRDAVDAEMARIHAGELALLDDTALKDRFQQFLQIARELLSDFREVEHNFRQLDRAVRERIALWDGAKGALLELCTSRVTLSANTYISRPWSRAAAWPGSVSRIKPSAVWNRSKSNSTLPFELSSRLGAP